MKKVFLMLTVVFVSLLLCVVPIKVEAKSITCNYVNPYGGDLVLTFGDKPETGYYVNNNYNNVFIDSGTSSIKKFYFGEISNKGNLNTAGSFSYHGKNWVFDETLRGPFGECPLLEYLEVKDKDSKDYTMLSSKNSEYCRKYDCNSIQLKDSNINLGESTYRRTCKYKNPFGGNDITFEFLDGGTHIASPSTSYSYQGHNKNIVTTNNMYISPANSSIKEFYVAGISSYNNTSIYDSPGSFSYGGANWIFASSMTGKVWTSGSSCPSLTYSSYTYLGNTRAVLHNGNDKDCSGGSLKCQPLLLTQNGTNAEYVGSCSLNIKYKDVSQKITFSSYSNGDILYSIGSGGGNKVDFTLDKPIDLNFSNRQGNIVENTNIYIKKDDLKNLIKIDNNNVLTCYSATVCSEMYNQYSKTLYVTTSADKCTNPGNSMDVDVETEGDSNSGGSLDPTKPSTNVSSKCTDYLGHASNNGTIAHFLDNIWDIIKVGSILLVIVFAMIEFAKTLSNDKEKIPVVLKRTVMRLIFLVVLLILPTLVEALGSLAGVDGILCGIK